MDENVEQPSVAYERYIWCVFSGRYIESDVVPHGATWNYKLAVQKLDNICKLGTTMHLTICLT